MGDFTHHEELSRPSKGSTGGSEAGGASPASASGSAAPDMPGSGGPAKTVGAVVGEGGATQVCRVWRKCAWVHTMACVGGRGGVAWRVHGMLCSWRCVPAHLALLACLTRTSSLFSGCPYGRTGITTTVSL